MGKTSFYNGLVLPWDHQLLTNFLGEAGVWICSTATAAPHTCICSQWVFCPFPWDPSHWQETDQHATNSCSCFFISGNVSASLSTSEMLSHRHGSGATPFDSVGNEKAPMEHTFFWGLPSLRVLRKHMQKRGFTLKTVRCEMFLVGKACCDAGLETAVLRRAKEAERGGCEGHCMAKRDSSPRAWASMSQGKEPRLDKHFGLSVLQTAALPYQQHITCIALAVVDLFLLFPLPRDRKDT